MSWVPDDCTVPTITNMFHILANIGHRFGHQACLYESSGQNSAIILNGFGFCIYPAFSKISKYCKQSNNILFLKWTCVKKTCRSTKTEQKTLAAILLSPKQCLEVAMHMSWYLDQYLLFHFVCIKGVNYAALPIIPSRALPVDCYSDHFKVLRILASCFGTVV